MPTKVTLYEQKSEGIKVNIQAYYRENGDLFIDGYDIGSLVEEQMGDSDYEYQATVEKKDLATLAKALKISDFTQESLLDALVANFKENDCFSRFLAFLKKEGIEADVFYWR